jgi:LuxR family transcriptional regulator, maltose regulon positive regulatory protein
MDTPGLLRTKLLIPPVRRGLVARPQLLHRLDQSLSRPLTLVSAPAGYGKTTLLSRWARQLAAPIAWFSLDEEDNDPVRFVTHLCAALEQADPALFKELAELVRPDRFGGLGAPGSLDAVQTALVNRLGSVPRPFVLVLDDLHLVSAHPVHRFLTFLLEHLPPQMHLVIASRADPPLPLARLRARDHLMEIRLAQLRFSLQETARFLSESMGLSLEEIDIDTLAARTEGWAAGLQMAASSIQARGDAHRFIAEFKGSNRYVLDYLVEEVFQRQPPGVQAFLLQTSILDRLTGALCDAVTEQGGGQAMLEMLERANLFIVPLDDEREWYRYHRLFADLLQKRLGESQSELASTLHCRASAWHERHGFPSQAVAHALAAGDFERGAQLIETVAEAMLLRSESVTLLRWLDALTEAQLHARPSLCAYHAWALLMGGSPLDVVETRLDSMTEDASILALPLRAWVSHYRGDVGGAIEQSERALQQLPGNQPFLRGLAALNLAAAYHTLGDSAASQRVMQEVAQASYDPGNAMIAVSALCYQAGLLRREGKLREARSLYQQALDLATDGGGDRAPIASQALTGLAEIARELNELDASERYALEGVALARRWAQAGALEAYITIARIRQARGDWDGVAQAIQAVREVADGFKATDLGHRMADMAEAWMQVLRAATSTGSGQPAAPRPEQGLEGPRRWAERNGLRGGIDPLALERADDLTVRHLRKYEYPVAARLWMAEGRPGDALALLESALPIAEEANRVGLVIQYEVLMALAAQSLGQGRRAMQSLERALALAEPEGLVRVFLDEGKPMARLLYEVASQRIQPEYVGRLLAAFPTGDQPSAVSHQSSAVRTHHSSPSTQHSLIEPLSERELEVLRLVAEGSSNEEIAQRLVLSLSTVKFHTSNIFGKLAVKNRTEAVARARGLGILPLA